MAIQTNLIRRNGAYYCRVYIPKELQAQIGKKEVWRSLKTGSYKEATYYAKKQTSEILHKLGVMTHKPELTNEIIQKIGEQYFHLMLTFDETLRPFNYEDDTKRREEMSPEQLAAWEEGKEQHERRKEQDYIDAMRQGNLRIMGEVAERKLHLFGIELDPKSISDRDKFQSLCQVLLQKKVQSIYEIRNRNNDNWNAGISRVKIEGLTQEIEDLVEPPNTQDVTVGSGENSNTRQNLPRITLQEAIEVYNNASANLEKSEDVRQENQAKQSVFIDLLGAHSQVFDYEEETVENLFQMLKLIPVNRRGMRYSRPLKEIIEFTKNDESIRRISATTVNKYMKNFRALLNFTYRRHRLAFRDITEGIRAKQTTKARHKRNALSKDSLQALFSKDGLLKLKNHRKQEYKFWIPLISLCSSARLSEVMYLRNCDVIEQDSQWFFIVQEHEGRPLKTLSSNRKPPIHKLLIDCGFLEYWKQMKNLHSESSYLFQDAMKPKDPADAFSKFFARQLKTLGLKDSEKETFHSLRHSFRDATREAEIGQEAAKALGGWEDSGTDTNYGEFSDRQLNEYLQRLDFSFLDEVLDSEVTS